MAPKLAGFCCRGWRVAYNAVLNLHAKTAEASRAEAVFQSMLSHGPAPDGISINSVIAAHAEVPPVSSLTVELSESCDDLCVLIARE
jgi:pentatricopeptide repeat protein